MSAAHPTQIIQALPDGPATAANVSLTLQGAQWLLGPNGDGWIKDELQNANGVCVVRALELAAPNYQSYAEAIDLVKQASRNNHIDRWNNDQATTYQDVTRALQAAEASLHPSFTDRLGAFAGKLRGFFGL